MTTFSLTLLSKSHSYMGEYELPLTVIPRVGEIIEASAFLPKDSWPITFFVLSVTYVASMEGLKPSVTAREWFKGLRHEELQSRGWLVPHDLNWQNYDELEYYPNSD